MHYSQPVYFHYNRYDLHFERRMYLPGMGCWVQYWLGSEMANIALKAPAQGLQPRKLLFAEASCLLQSEHPVLPKPVPRSDWPTQLLLPPGQKPAYWRWLHHQK